MNKTSKNLLLFFITISGLVACDEKESPNPIGNAERKITSFKFSGIVPEVSATINEAAHTITAEVPAGTNVTALVPTILISENATLSPASGVARDFSTPVTYTVTADGIGQLYTVNVSVAEVEEADLFTLDTYSGSLVLGQGETMTIEGNGFPGYEDLTIVFIKQSDNTETELAASSFSNDSIIYVNIPDDQPLGDYDVRVGAGDFSADLSESITIVHHAPMIDSVWHINVAPGDTTFIYGRFFMESGNTVLVYNDENEYELVIIHESTTFIQVVLPEGIAQGYYYLYMISNDREMPFTMPFLVRTDPEIYTIDDFSYALGDTITITGRNLQKDGFATNINFIPFGSTTGPTLVETGIANEAGTEVTYTVPVDFPPGTYSIMIEVDFRYSEEYMEIIEITP